MRESKKKERNKKYIKLYKPEMHTYRKDREKKE